MALKILCFAVKSSDNSDMVFLQISDFDGTYPKTVKFDNTPEIKKIFMSNFSS